MSLVDFVKRPRIREAFDQHAAKLKTPQAFTDNRILVRDSGGWPPGLAGTAFDYLARIHIEREFRGSAIAVHRSAWISEMIRERLDLDRYDRERISISNGDIWGRSLDEAHEAARAYIAGTGCARCLSFLVQYMAHADLLLRKPAAFESSFDAFGLVARELFDMLDYFDPQQIFEPRSHIVLNPAFAAGEKIGGADGDLLIDDLLVDIKAVDQISMSKTYFRQLAGYAALHDLGGALVPAGVHSAPITRLGVYFARHGKLVETPLSGVFPGEGFARYREIFEEELRLSPSIRDLRSPPR